MILHPPFCISARLAPAIKVSDRASTAFISYEKGKFVIDLPDGSEHVITDFHPPQGRVQGANPLQDDFCSILCFLGACAESRSYGERMKRDPMAGENSDLFPENVGQWAQKVSDELSMLQLEIEEAETPLIEYGN